MVYGCRIHCLILQLQLHLSLLAEIQSQTLKECVCTGLCTCQNTDRRHKLGESKHLEYVKRKSSIIINDLTFVFLMEEITSISIRALEEN